MKEKSETKNGSVKKRTEFTEPPTKSNTKKGQIFSDVPVDKYVILHVLIILLFTCVGVLLLTHSIMMWQQIYYKNGYSFRHIPTSELKSFYEGVHSRRHTQKTCNYPVEHLRDSEGRLVVNTSFYYW